MTSWHDVAIYFQKDHRTQLGHQSTRWAGVLGADIVDLCSGNCTAGIAPMTCRPAVVLSYTVAAAAALLSGLCYTEFVVDLPTAGGAFNYVSVVFGEFTAWSVLPDPQKHKFLH